MLRSTANLALATLMLLVAACSKAPGSSDAAHESKDSPPAVIESISVETSLTTVKLSENAEQRLGVVTAPVQRTEIQRRKVYGGMITPAPDRTALVIAPVIGTVVGLGSNAVHGLPVGSSVVADEQLVQFLPLSASESSPLSAIERGQLGVSQVTLVRAQTDADARIQIARVQVEGAKTTLNRVEQLLHDKVGSQRAVDEAKTSMALAQETLEAAIAERKALDTKMADGLANVTPVALTAPIAGTVQNVFAVGGQTVSGGQAIVEIVDLRTVWVQVPVIATEYEELDREKGAIIRALGKRDENQSFEAKLVNGALTANPRSSTIDVNFEVSAHDESFRPGQRVEVSLFVKENESRLAIPAAAVLYDIYGGAWAYTEVGPRTYNRSRIDVSYVVDNTAIIEQGLDESERVVTDGAAELFGAEFGNDK